MQQNYLFVFIFLAHIVKPYTPIVLLSLHGLHHLSKSIFNVFQSQTCHFLCVIRHILVPFTFLLSGLLEDK